MNQPSIRFVARLAPWLAVTFIASTAIAQQPAASAWDHMARDNQLLLDTGETARHWREPADPMKIVGPIYYVGTRGLGAYLITTARGHILLNSAMPDAGEAIAASIRKLGFKVEDIRYIIIGHAHIDHVGAVSHLQRLSHAQVAIMAGDVATIESGGRSDFHYGWDHRMGFPPVKVDRVLRDGSTIRLGGIVMRALHTPGHTPGSTTWITQVREQGHTYQVVWPEGFGVGAGYRLLGNHDYPGVASDFRRSLARLAKLQPDIFLTSHAEGMNLEAKRSLAESRGTAAFVDPDGYRQLMAWAQRQFETEYAKEQATPEPKDIRRGPDKDR